MLLEQQLFFVEKDKSDEFEQKQGDLVFGNQLLLGAGFDLFSHICFQKRHEDVFLFGDHLLFG